MKGRDFRNMESSSNGDRDVSCPPSVTDPDGIL